MFELLLFRLLECIRLMEPVTQIPPQLLPRPATLLSKGLYEWCFAVNFAKISQGRYSVEHIRESISIS